MKKKQILYTSLAAATLATAGVAVVHADDTSASSTDASTAVVASTDASSTPASSTTESSSSSATPASTESSSTSSSSEDEYKNYTLNPTLTTDATGKKILIKLTMPANFTDDEVYVSGNQTISPNGTQVLDYPSMDQFRFKRQVDGTYLATLVNDTTSSSKSDNLFLNENYNQNGVYTVKIDYKDIYWQHMYHFTGELKLVVKDHHVVLGADTTATSSTSASTSSSTEAPSTSVSTETQASSSTAKSEESVASSTASSSTEAKKDETKASSTAASSDSSTKSSSSDNNTKASTATSSSDKGTKASTSDKEAKGAKEVFPAASTDSSSSSSAQGTKTVNPVATAANPAQAPKRTLPSTGEENSIVLVVVGIVLAVAGLLGFRKSHNK